MLTTYGILRCVFVAALLTALCPVAVAQERESIHDFRRHGYALLE